MASTTPKLFQPIQVGAFHVQNRVVLAPLTRMRAGPGEVPSDLVAEYYGQRAAPGILLITEATQVRQGGQGYPSTPGIFTQAQVDGWKKATKAVHDKGGYLVLQLWDVGRVSHSLFQGDDFPEKLPVSSSAVALTGQGFGPQGQMLDYETPRALREEEIPKIVEFYRLGAQRAKEAGFDGVEIHAANGYLLHQFLADNVNQRTDRYGGSVENRARIVLEVTSAVLTVFSSDRVGIRLGPWNTFLQIKESDPLAQYSYLLQQLDPLNLAYVHLVEPRVAGDSDVATQQQQGYHENIGATFRPFYKGNLIVAGGYKRDHAIEVVEKGDADLVAFGRDYIANPDLPRRLKENLTLNRYNRATFYGGGAEGYTDYPFAA